MQAMLRVKEKERERKKHILYIIIYIHIHKPGTRIVRTKNVSMATPKNSEK